MNSWNPYTPPDSGASAKREQTGSRYRPGRVQVICGSIGILVGPAKAFGSPFNNYQSGETTWAIVAAFSAAMWLAASALDLLQWWRMMSRSLLVQTNLTSSTGC